MRPRKVTPSMVWSIHQMTLAGKPKTHICEALEISAGVLKKIRAGSYLSLDAEGLAMWQRCFGEAKARQGQKTPALYPAKPAAHTTGAPEPKKRAAALKTARPKKLAPVISNTTEAVPPVTPVTEPQGEDPMLLQNAALTPEAREHFALPRNPFVDDVQSPDDVFQTASVRYVRASLLDAALHHGFVGIVGESGAGKSTLAEDLEERIRVEGREVVVMRPYVLAMEENDNKGKTLKSGQIAEAVIRALDPQAPVRSSPEARFRQVHDLLRASSRAGRRHLLLIEEAHCLPTATLKHLKRWLEVKDGLRRLIGVALIGQSELHTRLTNGGAELREVAQRCELVELGPLDNDLEGYLRHKFARFDLAYESVFAPDAADAIRARLIHLPRGAKPSEARSICYPLVVNNLVCRAMNAACRAGWPQVDAQVIAGC
jgi:type II secretory pathway predicted ATPase ExeA